MGFSFSGAATTSSHQHSNLASDGGQLSIANTRITSFSPIALAVAMS